MYGLQLAPCFQNLQETLQGGSFDVTTTAYEWTEVCELIGIYMSYLIGKKYDSKDIRLYRDDGLAVFKNVSEPASEKNKKTVTIFVWAGRPANNYRV